MKRINIKYTYYYLIKVCYKHKKYIIERLVNNKDCEKHRKFDIGLRHLKPTNTSILIHVKCQKNKTVTP